MPTKSLEKIETLRVKATNDGEVFLGKKKKDGV